LAGVLRLDGRATDPGDAARVDAMAEVIAHRGLATRRIDQHGPLVIANGSGTDIVTVVDGFISNGADVTAAYAQHGDRFVEHLDGAFAIALWDPRRRALLLARDRAGVRPL